MAHDPSQRNTQVSSLHKVLIPLWAISLAGFLFWLVAFGVNV